MVVGEKGRKSVFVATKKAKKVKDPNAPKKSKCGYMFFADDKRKELRANHTNMATLMTEIGRQWQVLSSAKKQKYEHLAKEDKERYVREKSAYDASVGNKENATGKPCKDPNAPKKNVSSYLFFCAEKRAETRTENPGSSMGSIGRLLGEKWQSLTPTEKKKYEELAAKDKLRYTEELRCYQEQKAKKQAKQPKQPML